MSISISKTVISIWKSQLIQAEAYFGMKHNVFRTSMVNEFYYCMSGLCKRLIVGNIGVK